ncbi:MAG: ABC transporter ATP-binding protein [Patescibacteria group bacterium]|nr:ABC transporter ATP-binding protein [Patescibacteria group bacterium]
MEEKIEKEKRTPVISVKDLSKNFQVGKKNDVQVLKKVNLEVFSGEFVILFGPSGSGKSTLLHSVLGLETPTSGAVYIRGENLYALDEDDRTSFRSQKIGTVYQQSQWIKTLNVLDNVALPLNILGRNDAQARERAWETLKTVNMTEFAHYSPAELSGGQQQLVCMARALVNNPWIIIADEPTGNLDTTSANNLIHLFQELNQKSKRTILMVTHNMDYLQYATKKFLIIDGKIIGSYGSDIDKMAKIVAPGVFRKV